MAYKRPARNDSSDDRDPLLLRPMGLVVVGVVFFLLVFTVLLWRDGRFDGLWGNKGAILSNAPRGWMMGGKDRAKVRDMAPPSGDTSVFDPEKDRFEAPPPNVAAPTQE